VDFVALSPVELQKPFRLLHIDNGDGATAHVRL